ncbi:HAMP domain-containing sensor histidine kinase [Deinococcus ruber]|uniref:histidine kinase n=1 Tax=Deinococcus ruber TaxID=1848197 RepID=A0A918FE18_9DEIO|nr:HAMP domain-containing sensor histidine kinase [Deinococcus ruber]GGR31716.1 two-component sensor histidine kinase [Deinococcus ruber]
MTLRRLTVRWRLTLFYALVSSVILMLSASLIFFSLQSSLQQGLDASLQEAAAIAASQLSGDENTSLTGENAGDRVQSQLPGSTVVQVFNEQGRLTDQLGVPRKRTPLVAGFVTVGRERIYTAHLPVGGWVQTSRSQVETLRTASSAGQLLLLVLPLLLLSGLAAGYVLADRALRPVDTVARLAQSIAVSGQYHLRVPVSPGRDELARLTSTVNAMLERLAATIEREKAFALAAAHELRTPLSVLQASAELSLERPRPPEHYVRTLETIRESGQEMRHSIESLLALARTNHTPEWQTVDLAETVLEAAGGQLAFAAARGNRLHLDPQAVAVQADPVALRLAATNLIHNAVLYGRPAGQVWIGTRMVGGSAVIEVVDDGPGLPDGELARVVQPFQRGLGQQGVRGAGLGLALASAIAEQHGGTLKLQRAKTGGLLARITFPPRR